MALDAHIVSSPDGKFVEWPACSFEDEIHARIFIRSPIEPNDYPQFGRMIDYYADVSYTKNDLSKLIDELSRIVPKFSHVPQIESVLDKFLAVCKSAHESGKIVMMIAD